MNLDVLKENHELTKEANLYIEPLAPLSLVTSMPGAYYRSQREPSDFMIYGMIENLLGWHFTDNERNPIIKDLKKYHKKNFNIDLIFNKTHVGYIPLLQNHLKVVNLKIKPFIDSYEDYWTQHLKDVDSRHIKGVRNYDSSLVQDIRRIREITSDQEQSIEYDRLMKEKSSQIPTYYQTPTKREFIIVQGYYGYKIKATEDLLEFINHSINNLFSPLYLGLNEGWIDIKMEIL